MDGEQVHEVYMELDESGRRGRVIVDGREMKGITDLDLSAGVGRTTRVTITFRARVVSLEEATAASVREIQRIEEDLRDR